MATLDPDVGTLLDALSSAGLTDLARAAASRATTPDLSEDEPDRQVRPISRIEQLDRANKTVTSRLQRELSATDRLRELMPKLELKGILVTRALAEGVDDRVDDLIAVERRKALLELQKAWNVAVGELRRGWEVERGE